MRRTRDDSPPEKRWPRGAQVHHLYVNCRTCEGDGATVLLKENQP